MPSSRDAPRGQALPPIAAVGKQSTPRLVGEQLARFIQEAGLQRGDRLPPTAQLARMLGVSVASLREGLKELEAYGVVSVRHGSGVFVEGPPGASLLQPVPYAALYPWGASEVLDLMEARRLIEVETARLAATRARPEQLDRMHELLGEMYGSLNRPVEFIHHDAAFHTVIAEGAQNVVYPKLLSAVREIFLAQQELAVQLPGAAERACEYHERIYRGLLERDPQAAARAMADHLTDVTENLVKALGLE